MSVVNYRAARVGDLLFVGQGCCYAKNNDPVLLFPHILLTIDVPIELRSSFKLCEIEQGVVHSIIVSPDRSTLMCMIKIFHGDLTLPLSILTGAVFLVGGQVHEDSLWLESLESFILHDFRD